MSAHKDDHEAISAAARFRATKTSPPKLPYVYRLGEIRAVANDNQRTLRFTVRGLAQRHVNWLLPTLGLAAISLLLLSLGPGS
jgi:hypothetical protein